MDKLHLLEDPHTEYGILRKCFSLPKLSYTMHTVDPRPHQGKLDKFHKAVRKNMERVLGVSMLDHQWLQATLLVAMGDECGNTCSWCLHHIFGSLLSNHGGGHGHQQGGQGGKAGGTYQHSDWRGGVHCRVQPGVHTKILIPKCRHFSTIRNNFSRMISAQS